MKLRNLFLILIIFPFWVNAQERYNKTIKTMEGDLNKDGILDKIVISQNTKVDSLPYLISIYFGDKNGRFTFIAKSNKYIDPENAHINHKGILDDAYIKKGIFNLNISWTRGMTKYKFRFQNNYIALIGLTRSSSEFGTIYWDDFNLSTGNRESKQEDMETGEETKKVTKQLIRPLPDFAKLKPYEEEWF